MTAEVFGIGPVVCLIASAWSGLLERWTLEMDEYDIRPRTWGRFRVNIRYSRPYRGTRIMWVLRFPSYRWGLDRQFQRYGWQKLHFIWMEGKGGVWIYLPINR